MDNLPTELTDTILEDAYYANGVVDVGTLRACARLCRAWSQPAQRLLFRNVVLREMHQGRGHKSFLNATTPETKRGRMLGGYVRVLEVFVGDKVGNDLDDEDLANILSRCPRLYELVLRVAGIHQFGEGVMEKLKGLASPGGGTTTGFDGNAEEHEPPRPLRIRALSLLSCGIQSPILYQLLAIWPGIQFLFLGFEIAAPPPKWQPKFKLYQLTLMRTPRLPIVSWLLSSSLDSLRIASFRDAPGRDVDPLLKELGPQLRSLRLMNYSLRTTAVLKQCPNLEEFVLVQVSTVFGLESLPKTLEHLSCRNLPLMEQSLGRVIDAVNALPKLKIVTCDRQASSDGRYKELEELCARRGIELYLDQTPFWVTEDPVYVTRFPRRKSVANFALMN